MRDPNYRLFASGNAVSVIGTWVQRVAQDWLVLELTDSGVVLGLSLALQFGPMLPFGLWGGLVVDRVDRRRLLIVTQSIQGVLALVLAVITATGVVTLWMVLGLALALGLVTVVDSPARHSFVADLVEPADYVNAQALNGTFMNAGRLIGPAIAGLLIATVGVAGAFFANALSFLAVIATLVAVRPRHRHEPRKAGEPRERNQLRAALRYTWQRPDLRACLLLVAVVALFGQNFRVVLPVLARDTFDGSADTYAWLTAAMGGGAVVGALMTAARRSVTIAALARWTLAFGVINVLAAGAPGLVLAAIVLIALGLTNITFNTLGRTLLLLRTDRAMQGRVIALHGMLFLGMIPLGAPLLGAVVEVFGARAGLVVAGVTAIVAAGVVLWRAPQEQGDEAAGSVGPPPPVDDAEPAGGRPSTT
ncbi:MAG: putative arabinose efflux permease, family [Blastococcus sp.]|nr:putative arabinose efflux permease, family [Blastococcus sp.]